MVKQGHALWYHVETARADDIALGVVKPGERRRRVESGPPGRYPSARGSQGIRATSMPSSANASACSGVVSP